MFKKIVNMLSGNVLGGANKIVKTVFGSKESRDTAEHTENMAFMQGIANEMLPRTNRTWWDSFTDGINRLVRPVFTFGTVYIFWYCIKDPEGFSYSMVALSMMPEQGWWFLFTIVTFWFGGKFIGKDMRPPKPIDPQVILNIAKARQEYEANQPAEVKQVSGVIETNAMKDRLKENEDV